MPSKWQITLMLIPQRSGHWAPIFPALVCAPEPIPNPPTWCALRMGSTSPNRQGLGILWPKLASAQVTWGAMMTLLDPCSAAALSLAILGS